MTKSEFDEIYDFETLREVAFDNGQEDIFDDVLTFDDVDELVRGEAYDYLATHYFPDLICALQEIGDDRSAYYIHNGGLDFSMLDEYDFDEFKERLESRMIDEGLFDDDEPSDECCADEREPSKNPADEDYSPWKVISAQNDLLVSFLKG